jgi:hypothetical protein
MTVKMSIAAFLSNRYVKFGSGIIAGIYTYDSMMMLLLHDGMDKGNISLRAAYSIFPAVHASFMVYVFPEITLMYPFAHLGFTSVTKYYYNKSNRK